MTKPGTVEEANAMFRRLLPHILRLNAIEAKRAESVKRFLAPIEEDGTDGRCCSIPLKAERA